MKYQKTKWVSGETLVSAENLNKIEDQLEILSSSTDELHESKSHQIEGEDTVVYRIKHVDEAAPFTILEVASPVREDGADSEATITLMREKDGESGGPEFVDFYNNGYDDSRHAGIRVQSRGTGQLRDFVFDFNNGKSYSKTATIKPDQFQVHQPLNVYGNKFAFCNRNGELASFKRGDDHFIMNIGEADASLEFYDSGDAVHYQGRGDYYIALDEGRTYINDKLVQVVDAGEARPGNVPTGYQFFDTTLGKPVWFNGANWVDATGTAV